MAGPPTLDKHMSDSDLLELKCSACEFTFEASYRAAIKRYGPHACPVVINMSSTCPNCGTAGQVWARVMVGEAHRRRVAGMGR